MAIITYPKDNLVFQRDTSNNPTYAELVITDSPNTILFFGSGSSPTVISASEIAITSSWAISASWAPGGATETASYALEALHAESASYAPGSPSVSASYAETASYAENGIDDIARYNDLFLKLILNDNSLMGTTDWAATGNVNFPYFINTLVDGKFSNVKSDNTKVIYGTHFMENNFIPGYYTQSIIQWLDPNYDTNYSTSYVSVLSFDTDFTDSGTSASVWTAESGASIDNTRYVLGGGSLKLSTGVNTLTVNTPANFDMSGDFTYHFWLNLPSLVPVDTGCGLFGTNDNFINMSIGGNNDYVIYFNGSEAFRMTIPNDTSWHHLALTRASGNVNSFLDGVLLSSSLDATAFAISSAVIGGDSNIPFSIYMDEFYFINGIALWSASFSLPTPQPSVSETAWSECNLIPVSTVCNKAYVIATIANRIGSTVINDNVIVSVTADSGSTYTPVSMSSMSPIVANNPFPSILYAGKTTLTSPGTEVGYRVDWNNGAETNSINYITNIGVQTI